MSRSVVYSAQDDRRVRQMSSYYYAPSPPQQQHHHHSSRHHRQSSSSYHSKSTDEESIESAAVYASRYTSSFSKEDILIAKIYNLRHALTLGGCGLFQRRRINMGATSNPRLRDPDDIGRGRTRYREWEYQTEKIH